MEKAIHNIGFNKFFQYRFIESIIQKQYDHTLCCLLHILENTKMI